MDSFPSGFKAQHDMRTSAPHLPVTPCLQNCRPAWIAHAQEAPPGGGMQRRAVLAGHSLQAGTSQALYSRSAPLSHPACIVPWVSLSLANLPTSTPVSPYRGLDHSMFWRALHEPTPTLEDHAQLPAGHLKDSSGVPHIRHSCQSAAWLQRLPICLQTAQTHLIVLDTYIADSELPRKPCSNALRQPCSSLGVSKAARMLCRVAASIMQGW